MIPTPLLGIKRKFLVNILLGCAIVGLGSRCSTGTPQDITGIYSDRSESSVLVLNADSTFIFSSNNGSAIYKELGKYQFANDQVSCYEGVYIDDFVDVNYIDQKSDSLTIVIDNVAEFTAGNVKVIVTDSIDIPVENNHVILNIRSLINRIYKNPSPEDFDKRQAAFVTDLVVQDGDYYIALFNPQPTSRITIKGKVAVPHQDRKKAFSWNKGKTLLTCLDCNFKTKIDTLFLQH